MASWISSTRRALEPAVVVASWLAVWELLSRSGLLSARDFPPASAVLARLAGDLQNPNLWRGIGVTLLAWVLGLGIVIVTAIPAGLAIASSRLLSEASHLVIEFMRTVPGIAALPILIFVYGVGFQLTLMLIVLTAFWPLLIQVMAGVKDVDAVARDTGRVYGLGRVAIFRQIVLPAAAPYVATGIRLSATVALVMAVAASLIAGGDGLGALIGTAAESAQVTLMYARIAVAGLLGLVLSGACAALERKVLHWHVSQRRAWP